MVYSFLRIRFIANTASSVIRLPITLNKFPLLINSTC